MALLQRPCLLGVLILALAALLAPVAGADTPIAATATPTYVSAYGGVTAWSEFDSEALTDGTGGYRLVLRSKGTITRPNISSRATQFDVTLGPDTEGRTVALYSRCERADGTGCDAYKYDLRNKKERKLDAISQVARDEAWPSQWRGNYAFVRVRYAHGGTPTVENRCDAPATRPVKERYGIKTVLLAPGKCGVISGQVLRKTTIAQTVRSFAPSNRTEVRLVSIKDGKSKVLAGRSFTTPTDLYDSPVLDDNYVYATRTGIGPTPRFVRLRRDTGSSKEVDAQTILAGSIARDKGVTTYVEVQGAGQGGVCAPVTPCRVVVTSADPFSSSSRTLAPRVTLTPPGAGLLGNRPLNVSGGFAQLVVQNGKVVRSEPVAGMPLEVLRAAYSPTPSGQTLVPTGVRATTGPDGGWGLSVPPPVPVFGYYTVVTRGSGIAAQAAVVVLRTSAAVTLDASPRTVVGGGNVTFSGTVAPVQPVRSVNILRQYGGGFSENLAQAPVAADGSFSAIVAISAAATYVAELPANPFDGSEGNATYAGTSAPVSISVAP